MPRRHSAETMLQPQHLHMNGNSGIATRRSRGLGSGRRLGSAPRSVKLKNGPLAVFRIIIITIILLCTIWVYLIINIIASGGSNLNSSPGGEAAAASMLARPHIDLPKNLLSDIGWAVKQKLRRVMMKMKAEHPVPLLDVMRLDSPVLIITYKRADYLERTLWKIFESHPAQQQQQQQQHQEGNLRRRNMPSDNRENNNDTGGRIVGAPIIISQDGPNPEVHAVIETYRHLFESKLGVPLYSLVHPRTVPVSIDRKNPKVSWKASYISLAAHLGWAINQTFSGRAYDDNNNNNNNFHRQQHYREDIPSRLLPLPQRVIILEEDIEISNDFFSLMNATADLLDRDDTLLAVSAFNDNGKEQFVSDPKRLVRSDFFPGLGWMISRTAWDGFPPMTETTKSNHHHHHHHPTPSAIGLKSNWAPGGFWDDWLRDSDQRKGRQILRPEVSRTFHFGIVDAASKNQNDKSLNRIELEENYVRWEDEDLSYLADASAYANDYWNRVSQAKLVEHIEEAKRNVAHGDVRLMYTNLKQFKKLANKLGIMEDEKAGVPRTGYEGIVELRYGRGNYFIYLTPPCVVAGNDRPEHFGKRAWWNYDKVSLLRDLGLTIL